MSLAYIYLSIFVVASCIVFAGCSLVEKIYLRHQLLTRLKGNYVFRHIHFGNDLIKFFAKMGSLFIPKSKTNIRKAKDLLIKAGFRRNDNISILYGVRGTLAIILSLSAFIVCYVNNGIFLQTLFFTYLFLLLGYFAPLIIIRRIAAQRCTAIFRELPDVLDIMLICLDSGMGFNNVLIRVGKELQTISPVLSKELNQYFHEVNSGLPRNDALRNLADRNGSKHLDSVVNVLIQSSKFGTDISRALRVYAGSLRKERLQMAEEKGVKVSTKLAFPLTLCILPALMIVISGGAILKIMHAFKSILN